MTELAAGLQEAGQGAKLGGEVELELAGLEDRWQAVAAAVKPSPRPAPALVEVEQITTNISQLVIPAPASEETEEEITTLPEPQPEPPARECAAGRGLVGPALQDLQTDMQNNNNNNKNYNSRSSSSSRIPLPVERVTRSPGKEGGKVGPPTLPKPRWYVESLHQSSPVRANTNKVGSLLHCAVASFYCAI